MKFTLSLCPTVNAQYSRSHYGVYKTQEARDWEKEAQIDALADIDACKLYEAAPYEYTLMESDAMMGGAGGDVVTLYKNNVMEW